MTVCSGCAHDSLLPPQVDGTGAPSFIGDVAISGGKISAVGAKLDVTAPEEIDATGKIVAPAWVDCHTHLDAQVMWDPWMAPATTNGIGTVVFGNCGWYETFSLSLLEVCLTRARLICST